MERDEKGRFLPGNKEGHRFTSNGDATDCALKANEVRRRNQTVAEAIRAELMKPAGNGLTKLEYLAAKVIQNHATGRLSAKDMIDIQKLLGEEVTTVNVNGPLVVTKEEAEALDKWTK